jgi:uncharacterized membrane protein
MLLNVVVPAVISALGWGLKPIIDKKALGYFDFMEYFFVKMLILGFFGFLFVVLNYKLISGKISKKSVKWVIYAIIVQFLAITAYFYALSVSRDTTIVVLLTYILPIVIVALLSHFYLKQKMNNGMIGSIAIIVLGLLGFGYYKDK